MELLQVPVHAVAMVTCVGQKNIVCHELFMLLICIWKAHKWFKMRGLLIMLLICIWKANKWFKMRGLLMLPFCIWAPLDGLKSIKNTRNFMGIWLHLWAHVPITLARVLITWAQMAHRKQMCVAQVLSTNGYMGIMCTYIAQYM